jgi:hypothetical protein
MAYGIDIWKSVVAMMQAQKTAMMTHREWGAVADEFGAEPEYLDEHGHGGELGEAGCEGSEGVELSDDGGESVESFWRRERD